MVPPVRLAPSGISLITAPVFLSIARRVSLPSNNSVFVIRIGERWPPPQLLASIPAAFNAGLFTMLSWGLPLGIIQACSPVFRLIAVMRPYGPLIRGRPITFGPPRPPAAMYCISEREPPGCSDDKYGAVTEGM